jgi:hypothetical protein
LHKNKNEFEKEIKEVIGNGEIKYKNLLFFFLGSSIAHKPTLFENRT